MAEIVKRTDVTGRSEDGWKLVYEIKRKDGELVTARVSCTRTAVQTAQAQDNAAALASMRNYAGIDVLEYAERVQSPYRRGRTLITGFYDSVNGGNLSLEVSYATTLTLSERRREYADWSGPAARIPAESPTTVDLSPSGQGDDKGLGKQSSVAGPDN
jgi:hypothetical protein